MDKTLNLTWQQEDILKTGETDWGSNLNDQFTFLYLLRKTGEEVTSFFFSLGISFSPNYLQFLQDFFEKFEIKTSF